jgi:hypothetical protein
MFSCTYGRGYCDHRCVEGCGEQRKESWWERNYKNRAELEPEIELAE